MDRALRAKLRATAAPAKERGKDAEGQVGEVEEVSGRGGVRENEERPGARANTAVFLATTPVAMLSGEPIGR